MYNNSTQWPIYLSKFNLFVHPALPAENPYPSREVVTVKLNDRVQEESEGKKVLIETVFEMNYKNGMWRKLQYKRPLQ